MSPAVPNKPLLRVIYFALVCCALGLLATAMANRLAPEPWPKLIAKVCLLTATGLNLIAITFNPERRVIRFVLAGFAVVSGISLILVLFFYR